MNKNNRWFNFFILYLGGVLVSISQLKIVPIQNEIVQGMGFSFTSISWLMSIFTLSGIFLSIPGGKFIIKIGPKKLLIMIMLCLILGNVIGFFSESYYLMLASRLIEGISFSMIIMVGIVFINEWFKDSGRGLATGIWGTFSAAGSLIAMNLFLPMTKSFGLKSPWLFIAALTLLMTVIYMFKIKDIKSEEKSADSNEDKELFKKAIRNKRIWILALAQGCMAFILFTFINMLPIIYEQMYGINNTLANRYAGYFGLFGIPFGIIAGYLIDKTKKGNLIILISFSIMSIAVILTNTLSGSVSIILQLILLSGGIGLSAACIMIIAPEAVVNKKLIGMSISIVNFVYYIGIFIGTPCIVKLVEVTNSWKVGINLMFLVSVMGSILVLLYCKTDSKKNKKAKKVI